MSDQLPLPGLEPEPSSDGGALADAVRRTIAEHQSRADIGEADAGKCAIALELCTIVVAKRQQRRMSTISNDLRLLAELLDSMRPEQGGEADAKLRQAMDEWEQAIREQGQPS